MSRIESCAQGAPSYSELITPDQSAAEAFQGPLLGWEFREVPMGDDGYYVAAYEGRMAFVTDPQGGLLAFMQTPPDQA